MRDTQVTFLAKPMAVKGRDTTDSVYYRHSGTVPFASRLSFHVRRKMFLLFMQVMRPGPETTVLDVGVTSDERFRESNYFEQMYPYRKKSPAWAPRMARTCRYDIPD